MTNIILLRQKFCHDKHTFVTTNTLCFVATKHMFCRDKNMLVVTKRLSQQTLVCCDKSFVAASILFHDKMFVATKMILVAAPTSDSVMS